MPIAHGPILLVGCTPAVLETPEIAATLSAWPDHPPAVRMALADVTADPALLDGAALVWVILDQRTVPGLYDAVVLIQDRQIPSALTRPETAVAPGQEVQEGIVTLPAGADPVLGAAILRTLASQTAILAEFKTDVDMLRRQQAGLVTQIGRMDEELRLAAKLQREFLPPRLPEVPGLAFRVLYRPATYVSGDIYDLIRLDEDHVGLFIADAVGHGVPAALMTVYIKQSLQTKEIGPMFPRNYRIVPPGEALARLNAQLVALQVEGVHTATAFYGVLNCRTLDLRYARAGHPLPLLLQPDGSNRLLESEGALLGVFPEETFEEASTVLNSGERLLLYSDGFETAFASDGTDRRKKKGLASNQYFQEFTDLACGPLGPAMDRLAAKLDRQAGSLNQVDDMTVVCVAVDDADQSPAPNAADAVGVAG